MMSFSSALVARLHGAHYDTPLSARRDELSSASFMLISVNLRHSI